MQSNGRTKVEARDLAAELKNPGHETLKQGMGSSMNSGLC